MGMRLHNQRGITLVELLAAILILALIIAPILTFSLNMLDSTMKSGDRNQVINIARGILDDAREQVSNGAETYNPSGYAIDLSAYNVSVNIEKYNNNPNLKEIEVIVIKNNSRLKAVELKTMVWLQDD